MNAHLRFIALAFICLTIMVSTGCSTQNDTAMQSDTQAGIVLRHIADDINDIDYPVITGLSDEAVQTAINGAINDLIFNFADSTTASFEQIDRSADPRNPQLEIGVDYLVGVNAGGILSLKFTLYWYAGGAHPMSYERALTFELATGRELALSDLFEDGSGYVEAISSVVAKGFAEAEMTPLTEFVSIDPDNEYFLSAEGIVIFYQRYEYMPYAYGFPEFTFTYDQAKVVGLIPEVADLAQTLAAIPLVLE